MIKKAGKTFLSCGLPGFCLLAFFVSSHAAQEITFSGEQDGYFDAGQYVATGTIIVKRGKTLTFAPGCVVRFKSYTGIVVEGTLKCVGWVSQPVIFTSDNNRLNTANPKYKIPAPFDWNGIQVADSAASVLFENVRIAYSTYGLDIKSSFSKVNLKSVVFSENGRSGITIEEKQLGVIDNEQFSFVQPEPENAVMAVKSRPAAPTPKVEAVPGKKMSWRTPLRLSLGAVAVVGAAFGVYENMQGNKYLKLSQDQSNVNASDDWNKTQDAKNMRTIGYAVAIAAACGFTLTFFF
jgi:hypothetical protein